MSSQVPTQRENTQREGWAFQQWPEGKSEVGLCLPRGHREEQSGASRPQGMASTLQDNWLVGSRPESPQGWAAQEMKGPLGGRKGSSLGRGWLKVSHNKRGACERRQPLQYGMDSSEAFSVEDSSLVEGRMDLFLTKDDF